MWMKMTKGSVVYFVKRRGMVPPRRAECFGEALGLVLVGFERRGSLGVPKDITCYRTGEFDRM